MMNPKWNEFVTGRCIIRPAGSSDQLGEVFVAEVSPSQKLVQFISVPSGQALWVPVDAYELVELLPGQSEGTVALKSYRYLESFLSGKGSKVVIQNVNEEGRYVQCVADFTDGTPRFFQGPSLFDALEQAADYAMKWQETKK